MKCFSYSPKEWVAYAESAHKAVFNKIRPASADRHSYVLLAVTDESDEPVTYVSVREHDDKTVYWGFGGVFPKFRNTIFSGRGYDLLLSHQISLGTEKIYTFVENTNVKMLRAALGFGFKIVGTRAGHDGAILVDMLRESKQ